MLLLTQFIILILMVLMSVAFFSLFERKLLSLIQIRLGPNKVGLMGIMQPFSDAMKLLSKVSSPPSESSKLLYMISPIIFMCWSLLMWIVIPIKWNMMSFATSTLFMIFCFNLSVYGLVSLGWFSNSKFASIGSVRSISQSISYEIIMSFVILFIMMLCTSLSMKDISNIQSLSWLMMSAMPLTIMMMITMLAESNRSPFDLSEGESELVSGFCIEYGGMQYTMIFLSENLSIMFLSVMFSILFLNGMELMLMKLMTMVFLFVWIRGTMPRIRIDNMMKLCWIEMMPLIISIISIYSMML